MKFKSDTRIMPAQISQLRRHISDLGGIRHFTAKEYDQHPIHQNVMYTVELHPEGRGRLQFRNRYDNSIFYPKGGTFDFIIPSDEPNTLIVMPNLPSEWNMGHTSMTRGSVRFAGEMTLSSSGTLLHWNGASGHFQPYNYLHHRNLTPWTRRILPADKFQVVCFI